MALLIVITEVACNSKQAMLSYLAEHESVWFSLEALFPRQLNRWFNQPISTKNYLHMRRLAARLNLLAPHMGRSGVHAMSPASCEEARAEFDLTCSFEQTSPYLLEWLDRRIPDITYAVFLLPEKIEFRNMRGLRPQQIFDSPQVQKYLRAQGVSVRAERSYELA